MYFRGPFEIYTWDGWMDGMGWDAWDGMGWMGYQKCPSNFCILCRYIEHVYTYLYIYTQKLSPHSCGFQIFMSSWGS